MTLISPQLDAFMAVCEYKTVHAAAESIHLTQAAVTQRIRGLESKLGATLFLRSRRGMELTAEGEALLRYCHSVKALEGEALAQIRGSAEDVHISVRITSPTSLMRSRIIPLTSQLTTKYPYLLLHYIADDVEQRQLSLRSGQCDFAIIQQDDVTNEMDSKELRPEEYVLVCSPKWQERTLEEIISTERIIDYDPSDTLTFNYLREYNLWKLAQHERHFVNRTEALALLIAQGVGYGVLTREFAEDYLERDQLMILNQAQTYKHIPVLAWYPRHEPAKYFSDIIKVIQ